ncbi:Desulfoferrodoxin [Clostridium sp. C105KSO15]|nr:Desulfoferrodoxin [Clostridium sp. C105KSO15]
MKNEPVFLTDKNHNVILEAISGAPNAALPDNLKPFEILEPNTSDGASEKHVPIIETDGNHVTVTVGSVSHPMSEEHSITWICLQTTAGSVMRVSLSPDCEPVACFTMENGDSPKAAFAYCNLHGFWKTEA